MHQTWCREIKRYEERERNSKNPFASRLAEFDTTLKPLRITDQWYIVPVKFRFGRNRVFLALLVLPLDGGPKEGKRYYWTWNNNLTSDTSFTLEKLYLKRVERVFCVARRPCLQQNRGKSSCREPNFKRTVSRLCARARVIWFVVYILK